MAAHSALAAFLQAQADPALAHIQAGLAHTAADDSATLIALYKQALPHIEQVLWRDGPTEQSLAQYQAVFRELESHIAAAGQGGRHHIILFIPVADRPLHLTACLDSLLQLCQLYRYGGEQGGRFHMLSVLIGDDSKDPACIEQHRQIVADFHGQGLNTIYFGQAEQLAQIEQLSAVERQQLQGVLGKAEASAFYHKGSPRMRNIAHLKLHELAKEYERVLFFSLDSDQEFQVKISGADGDRDVYALNFFYYLDEIFSQTDTCILTGKVVGDPPVSPAVMTGNFLQDVSSFIEQMAAFDGGQGCGFHTQGKQKTDDAAYHDMADMFGFRRTAAAYHYPCPLQGQHDNGRCLLHFAAKVNAFFYGEHPTRKTYYEYSPATALTAARTVYPGNYVFNKEALNYFIPFAPLKLRMNGPVMGRVVKALLKDRFVSANLPMLHKRTVHDTGQSEFRPDIHQQAERIDLGGEFERQFFGDVMLFSMEKLTAQGYPAKPFERETIRATVMATEQDLQQRYQAKHDEIMDKLSKFRTLLEQPAQWWLQSADYAPAVKQLRDFADNIEHNFGEASLSYRLISQAGNRQARLGQIIDAIIAYPAEQQAWQAMLRCKTGNKL